MRRRNVTCFIASIVVLYAVYFYLGLEDYIFARSFEKDFDYPLSGDIRPLVDAVLNGERPERAPINHYPYRFLTNSGRCDTLERPRLFIAVKSALQNLERRAAIRRSYARDFHSVLFFVGVDPDGRRDVQRRVDAEMATYHDVIQADFHDAYFNNTIKTMMTLRWLVERCSAADYYLLVDDDMYVSVPNLLRYLDGMEAQEELFAGHVFESAPLRLRSSKWRVPRAEYPWDRWPRYVTGGAVALRARTARRLRAAAPFVRHFRLDDVYLGIVAHKAGIKATHCENIHFHRPRFSQDAYRDVIAAHGFDDPEELVRVWTQLNAPPG